MTMYKTILLLCITGIMMTSGCNNQTANSQQSTQSAQTLNRNVTLQLEYLLYLPADYHATQKDRPLLIFLHGMGERGSDINKVKLHGPPKLVEEGKEFPFIIVSPQCPATGVWSYEAIKVMALIDDISETYNVDQDRIYLTGLSMGGFGTWTLAATYPDRFAAIAPICGGGSPHLADTINMPVWAFHGDADEVVPLQRSQQMVDAVNKAGHNAKLTIYPGVEHDSWSQTYENNELYEWLLSHSK
ncbi:MAG: carboxylesterase family protein [Planctomycetota bacterium]|jgi:predicted peptidase